MPGMNNLYVGRSPLAMPLMGTPAGYVSPFLLEVAHSGTYANYIATGSLTANAPGLQTVSCSRASSAYCRNGGGGLVLLGSNTVRVEPEGLLVEGASTNELIQTGDFSNVAWQLLANGSGVAPVVTHNSTDVTDPNGGNTADKIAISACSGADASFLGQNIIKSAVPWSGSVYLRTLSGTATVWLFYTQGGVYKSTVANVTTTWQRFTNPNQTLSAVSWYTALGIDLRDGTQTSQSAQNIYAWKPQSEALSFATSPIDCTTVAATRSADVVTVANPLNPSNPGTWRMGATVQPLTTWANISAISNPDVFLAVGTNAAANSYKLHVDGAGGLVYTVLDNVVGIKSVTASSVASGSGTISVIGFDAAGTLTTSPAGTPAGAGTGVVTTQAASVTLGSPQGIGGFNHWGWLTNLFVHNA